MTRHVGDEYLFFQRQSVDRILKIRFGKRCIEREILYKLRYHSNIFGDANNCIVVSLNNARVEHNVEYSVAYDFWPSVRVQSRWITRIVGLFEICSTECDDVTTRRGLSTCQYTSKLSRNVYRNKSLVSRSSS